MKEVRKGTYKYYKGEFFIAFYDKDGEWPEYVFDNVREILTFMNKPITRNNVNIVNNEIYRALKSDNHYVRFLTGDLLTLYIIKKGRAKLV